MTKYIHWIREYVSRHNGNVRYHCQEASDEMVKAFPELRQVRGYVEYDNGFSTAHWWCETTDGIVVDPTASQFYSVTEYDEYNEEKHGPLPTSKCMDCGSFVYDGGVDGFCDKRCREATLSYLNGGSLF